MNITEVKIFNINRDKLKAYASVTFEKQFVVTGLKVMEGSKGLFVAMPSQKKGEEYKDVCYPITKEFRAELINAVLERYGIQNDGSGDFISADDQDTDNLPFK